ncbi:MAG: hypothetical protein H6684_05895 [Deltaproteobacteria bacterium]|nr:hypothetical protein [bacterium]MCB9477913.1 hypothetical protein [Deltaproteobacteria bacterium]MCB9478728.1 hypothetical protein [Deltaproteobacteria bacterium]MCB9488244.1 hypothetical protein [Deltaproteobacteria bacterium]
MSRYLTINERMPRQQTRPYRRGEAPSMRLSWKEWVAGAALLLLLLGAALLSVWSSGRTVKLGYEISVQHEQRQALLDQRDKLREKIKHLSGMKRLSEMAPQYGLEYPTVDQQVRLDLKR